MKKIIVKVNGHMVDSFAGEFTDNIYKAILDAEWQAEDLIANTGLTGFAKIEEVEVDPPHVGKNKFINLTPHDINLVDDSGEIFAIIPRSGDVARVQQTTRRRQSYKGVPVSESTYGDVEGLPRQEATGPDYIVSKMVCDACPHRSDLYIVNETVRNDKGQIIGAQSIAQNPNYKWGLN